MPQRCSVPKCGMRTGGHTFPSDARLLKQWVIAIRRNARKSTGKRWFPSEHDVVCKKHFQQEDYITRIYDSQKCNLKPGAIPSKFDFKTDKTLHSSISVATTSKTRSGQEFSTEATPIIEEDDLVQEEVVTHHMVDYTSYGLL
uniref:THAP domain-containing protein 3 n=1 Tax=Ciona intestinalis TaxID=7719 RepID=UPI00089DC67B|nr:THAP domain-containing protein 3 [Ciona intestinalis]|eukprot:XP_018672252.1 THAP domain-containing protein 3 [Ciona intestinalis]